MYTNYSLSSNQQNISFNGLVDKRSAKLAKKIGPEIYESLCNLANGTSSNTVVKLEDMGKEYCISAYNKVNGYHSNIQKSAKSSLYKTINGIESRKVDEEIINNSINGIKQTASIYPMSRTEKKILEADAQETIRMQEEIGVTKPFLDDVKRIMADAKERYYNKVSSFVHSNEQSKVEKINARAIN